MAIDATILGLGLLIWMGRWWLVGFGAAAAFGFWFAGGFPDVIAIVYAAIFVVTTVGVYAHRRWFEAMGRYRRAVAVERAASRPR